MDGNGENVVFSEKSKERPRKLSPIHRKSSSNDNCKMGSGGSNGGISKRCKLPRKFFDDYNTVDHVSVPRKLRSAMKRRNHGSISPSSSDKKQNHAIVEVELRRKDARKKCKESNDESLSWTSEGPITKDEEEVVETLSALAVMFRFPINNKKNNFDRELVNANSLPLPEGDSPRPAFEDSTAPEKEEDSNSHCPSTSAEAANPSLLEGPALESVQVQYSTEYHSELDNTMSERNLQPRSLLSKSENTDGKPSCISVGCKIQSDLNLGTDSKYPKHTEATIYSGMQAAAVSSKRELQYTFKERESSGPALWPGLFSAGSLGSVTRGLSMQPSTAKTPGCLHTAASLTRSDSSDNGVLTDKDFIALIGRKKTRKRCSTQIYICRLIEALEIAERKDGSFFHPTHVTPNQGSKQGEVLLAANNLNAVQSCSNEANSLHSRTSDKNPNEIRNAILLHKWLLQDQQQGDTQKQCSDFLSLSTGGGGLEATNSTNKAENVLEPWTQSHIPYLHSLAQNHAVLPFSMPQIRFCSTPFADNRPSTAAAKQVQIPLPPHLGNPLSGLPNFGFSPLPKQEQQQEIWTTQKRPMGVSATYFPKWHNGRRGPYGIHYPQFIFPPSHPSLEVHGPKYSPISQQQLMCNEHL